MRRFIGRIAGRRAGHLEAAARTARHTEAAARTARHPEAAARAPTKTVITINMGGNLSENDRTTINTLISMNPMLQQFRTDTSYRLDSETEVKLSHPIVKIDVTEITPDRMKSDETNKRATLLTEFVERGAKAHVGKQIQAYTLIGFSTRTDELVYITFPHHLLPRHSVGKNKDAILLEVKPFMPIEQVLNIEDSTTKIFRLAGTVVCTKGEATYRKSPYERIVKEVPSSGDKRVRFDEGSFLALFPVYGYKGTVTDEIRGTKLFIEDNLILPQDHSGQIQEDLLDLINRDIDAANTQPYVPVLNEVARIQLCVDLINSVMEIHKKGVIHRDIKPENFIVHTKDTMIEVLPIDFDLSMKKDVQDMQLVGTEEYCAPEIQRSPEDPFYSEKTDSYSLSLTLAILFEAKRTEGFTLKLFASGEDDPRFKNFTPKNKRQIFRIISMAGNEYFGPRWSIEKMKEEFETLLAELKSKPDAAHNPVSIHHNASSLFRTTKQDESSFDDVDDDTLSAVNSDGADSDVTSSWDGLGYPK
ncbi:MAG TPA: hypothetical protein VNC84_07660 [Gammaproteobacteria bacterium]|jgi:hypothetical protein|nr:hypothetical protein [Gammaproteobacteria bacterium]